MPEIAKLDTIHEGRARYHIVTVRLPDGSLVRREVEDHGPVASVLPYDPARKLAILVRQFRAGPLLAAGQLQTLECIAGREDADDRDPATTTRREALEEAGLRLEMLEPVASVWSTPGFSTERVALFLAPYSASDRVAEGGGIESEHERIEVIETPLAELAALADRGELDDMKTLVLVQTLRLRRPDLFRA